MNPEWKKLPALDREDSRPLHAQLFAILTDFIQENHISPGALLPTEIELMQWFGLSRTPVRQAIQQLENRGLVRKIQGKGTFVCAPKRKKVVRLFRSLEPNLAVNNIVLNSGESVTPQWAVELEFPSGERVHVLKRLKVFEDRPLALEFRVLALDAARSLSENDFKTQAVFDFLDQHPESRIHQVQYGITSTMTSNEEAREMGVEPGMPLLVRSGLYLNQMGRPIMAAKVLFLAERVELRYEFHREDENWGTVKIM